MKVRTGLNLKDIPHAANRKRSDTNRFEKACMYRRVVKKNTGCQARKIHKFCSMMASTDSWIRFDRTRRHTPKNDDIYLKVRRKTTRCKIIQYNATGFCSRRIIAFANPYLSFDYEKRSAHGRWQMSLPHGCFFAFPRCQHPNRMVLLCLSGNWR